MQSIETLAKNLDDVLQNSSTKEEEICTMILNNDSDTRAQVANYYSANINPEGLDEVLKSKLSGNYQHFCVNCFRSLIEYDCHQLYRAACKGFSTDNESVYEIILTRPHWMLVKLKEMFQEIYNKDLPTTLEKECSKVGKLLNILIATEPSEETNPDHTKCEQLANLLIKTKIDKWHEEEIFTKVFASTSPEELILIGRYFYKNTNGKNLVKYIKNTMKSNKFKEFFKIFMEGKINPAEYFADRLRGAIKGLGTDTNLLERILITRNEVDMDYIRDFYLSKYKVSLESDIEGDTSGIYQKLAIGLANKVCNNA